MESLEERSLLAVVAVFDDAAYVDTSGGISDESDTIQAALTAAGHTVQTFSGITKADFLAGLSGAAVLVIPELENGDLNAALSTSARTLLQDFVQGGGGLIVAGDSGSNDTALLNAILGATIADGGASGLSTIGGAASGTPFAGGPATLPNNNQVSTLLSASLPAGARRIYTSPGANTTVALMNDGFGRAAYLGWDWFDGAPLGSQDGGWNDVLNRAVAAVAPNSPLQISTGPFANDGDQDNLVLQVDPNNPILARLTDNGTLVRQYTIAAVNAVNINGSNDIDYLTVRFGNGNPLPIGGIRFAAGGPIHPSVGDVLRITGDNVIGATFAADPAFNSSGRVVIHGADDRNIDFSGSENAVYLSGLSALRIVTPNAADDLILGVVTPDTGIETPDQNVLRGASDGVGLEEVAFKDIPTVIIDAAANDGAGAADRITIESPLVASGLVNLTILTGGGDDTVNVGSNFKTPAGNAIGLDAGSGFDRLSAAGNTNFTLTDAGLTAASGGGVDTRGTVEQVSIAGGAANNTFSAAAFTLGPTSFFGGGGNDSWTLSVPGNARFTQAANSTDGVLDLTGQADVNYFTGVESISLSSRAQTPANIEVRGTDDNDTLALQFLGGSNRTWINDGAVLAFANFGGVTLTGRFGDDKFSVAPVGLAGVASITVAGGDPTASDELAISGTSASNAISFAPTSANAGSVTIDAAPVINFNTIESVVVNGLAGNDNLTVRLPVGNNAATYTPGASPDSGAIESETLGVSGVPLTALTFTNLGANGSVTFANAGQVRNDVLDLNGTDAVDLFRLANDTAQIRDSFGSQLRTVPINTPGVNFLAVHGLEGDDRFDVAADLPYASTLIDGGDPSASDVLNLAANEASADTIRVALASGDIFGLGGTVSALGVETVNIDGNGGAHALVALGSSGDDRVVYTPTGPEAGTFAAGGSNTVYNFSRISAPFFVDAGSDLADEVTVVGTNNHDFIVIDSPNRTVTVENAAGVQLKPVVLSNDLEVVNVLGRLGNDTFLVVPAPPTAIAGDTGAPINLLVYVDGGQPGASDALVIADAQGQALLGDLFAVVNRGRNANEGVVRIFQATGGEPNQFPDIVYTDVEVVSPNMALGADGDPQVLVLGPDVYEPNESRTNAAFLGSSDTIGVANLAIFPNAFEHRFVAADQDFFRVVAKHSGTLDFRAYFKQIDLFLPGRGDLQIEVRDETGAVIANFGVNDFTADDERRRIPVVAGETYFVQVFGALATTVNAYSLEIVNTPAPTPRDLELTDADLPPTYFNTDTGRSQFDNVTRDNTPTILIRLDDALLLNDVPGGGLGTPPDGQTIPIPFIGPGAQLAPGYRVAVFDETDTNNPVFLGFADKVPGQPGVYYFTFVDPLADGSHFITAKVQMIDPSADLDEDFGPASQSLEIVVDTAAPPVFFGAAAVANDGLDPQSDSGVVGQSPTFADRVTNDTTPAFFGAAEADAIVRLYADRNANGTVDAGDVFLGLTVAVPLDGSNQFPGGQWNLTTTVDLNNPAYFGLDGTRQLLVTAEDLAGNVSAPTSLAIFIDTAGPQVTGVFVTANPGFDLFDPKPSQGPTPLVPQLTVTLRDLPNRDPVLFANHLALLAAVAADPGQYELRGDHNGIVAIRSVTVTLNPVINPAPAIGTIVLTFFSPLPDDRYTLTLRDSIVDPAGNNLDGNGNASQPLENPLFPTGDGQPGGDFVARFTVDSRPEIGAYSAGTAAIDINGTFEWDPQNLDKVNRDLIFTMGFDSDRLFNGDFADVRGDSIFANGFDKLAAYGKVGGAWRFLVDFNSDGVWDLNSTSALPVDGLPIAGDFSPFHPGEEVGVFDGQTWYFDTDGDFSIDPGDLAIAGNLRGYPLVGDFDGNGSVDLATWSNDTFYFDLNFDGNADSQLAFGFSGVLERPVAEDYDRDGMTDLGLWVPGRSHSLPEHASEWFMLISGGDSLALDPNRQFTPAPFGNDLHAQFGDDFALPLFGNFDPPVVPAGTSVVGHTWIDTLYGDVLGRDPSLSEINYWSGQIARGVSYLQIAQSFMVSDERRGGIVDSLYRQYIGRAADQAGLRYWIGMWSATGGPEHVQAGIIGSNEYYRQAGGTDGGWVSALYRNILGRDVDQDGLDYWTQYIQTHSKQSVVLGFVTSDEYRLGMIKGWYQQYLGRELDDAGAQFWLKQMKNGLKQEAIQNGILASAEYRNVLG